MAQTTWIAADWGTSRLRVWAMGKDQEVLADAASDKGMNSLKGDEFESALLELIGQWLCDRRCTTVIACGMVGARQGWAEPEYASVPCPPLSANRLTQAPAKDPRLKVLIIPGLSQLQPADVMRGEETQIAGFMAEHPDFVGTICLPGTHSKWVSVAGGTVHAFKTYMTGELFALLEQQSILRHSLTGPGSDDNVFEKTFEEIMSDASATAAGLFSIRAADLLEGVPPSVSRARLSAGLIAAELTAARPYWTDSKVVILGSPALAGSYGRALEVAGADVEIVDGTVLTLRGLIAAHAVAAGMDKE